MVQRRAPDAAACSARRADSFCGAAVYTRFRRRGGVRGGVEAPERAVGFRRSAVAAQYAACAVQVRSAALLYFGKLLFCLLVFYRR